MHSSTSMTIRELPKTKKMAVDEMHPILKMQKNVLSTPIRNSTSIRWRDLMKLVLYMGQPCLWCLNTKDKFSLNLKECQD